MTGRDVDVAVSARSPTTDLLAMQIRVADPLMDAAACAQVYAPWVTDAVVSFDVDPPDAAEMTRRMRATIEWIVAEDNGQVLGYAYGRVHGERAAFRWSAEVSIYLDPTATGRGLGRALYTELLQRLTHRGYRMATAVIVIPNEPSIALHEAVGFTPVGVFHAIGYKHGQWRDQLWMQRPLGEPGPPAGEPR